MGIEPKKILKLVCTHNNQFDILTQMPEKEIIEEIEYETGLSLPKGPPRDIKWCRIEGLTPTDEPVPAAVRREDIRGYLIIPYHPSENVQPAQRVAPRILQ